MKKFLILALLGLTSGYMLASPTAYSSAETKKKEALEAAYQRLRDGGSTIPVDLPPGIIPSVKKGKTNGKNPLGAGTLIPSVDHLKQAKPPIEQYNRAPEHLNQLGMNLYGYIAYEYTLDFEPGMFEFQPDGSYDFMWIDSVWSELQEGQTSNGWLNDGKYQGIQASYIPGAIYAYFWFSIDFETGELLDFKDYFGETSFAFIQCTYNPEDDRVYGIGHDFYNKESMLYWASAPVDDLDNVEIIAPVSQEVTGNPEENNMAYALCYNPSDGYFYAITVWGELVRIHKDGTQEPVLVLHGYYNLFFPTGLVWSPVNNYFVWAPYYGTKTSGLVILDPATGNEEVIDYYPDGPQITSLLTTDEVPESAYKPLRATINSMNFFEGSMTGSVDFTMPTKLANGTAIPAGATLSYTALLDNEEYATGTAAAGSQVTVDYTVNGTGYHTFGIYTTYDGVESFAADKRAWIGNDVPFPPANVELTQTLITWDPVGSVGIHGGYVNPEEVVYSIWINNQEEIGRTKETSLAVDLDSEEMKSFIAYVFAEFKGTSSKAGKSNKIITGNPYTVPMYLEPTQEEFSLMTVVDANGDGDSWYWSDYYDCIITDYSSMNLDMDDYLFLPAVEITDTEYLYEFSLDAVVGDDAADFIEYVEVVWATEPNEDNLGGYIIDEFYPEGSIYRKKWTHKSGLWKVETPGIYYIGIHTTSPAHQIGVAVKNFDLIKSKVTLDAPAAPVITKIKSGAQGSLNAEVTVALPTKSYDGNTLDSNLEMTVHFNVNGEPIQETVTGKPGEDVTATITTLQGDNTVTAYITAGELQSPVSEPYVIFTGQSVPSATQNVTMKVSEDMLTAVITWDPVTTSALPNGYVDPEDITYTIYMAKTQGEDPAWSLYRENVKETSFEYELPSYSEMALYMFGIETRSPEGSTGEIVSSDADMMGKPYSLPFYDAFEDPDEWFETTPWLTFSDYNGQYIFGSWVLTELDQLTEGMLENQPAVIGYSTYSNDYGLLSMPRFTTKGIEHAKISIPTVYAPYMARLTVLARIYGNNDYITVGSADTYDNDVYEGTLTFNLPDSLMDQEWVEIYFLADYEFGYTFTAILSVEVTPTEDSGVSAVSSEGRIFGGKNSIIIKGLEGKSLNITTLDGKQVAAGQLKTDNESYTFEPGVYIVKAGDKRAKVIVK